MSGGYFIGGVGKIEYGISGLIKYVNNNLPRS